MNNLGAGDQTQAVHFPDVNPSDLPENAQFSMTAGDFLEVCMFSINRIWRTWHVDVLRKPRFRVLIFTHKYKLKKKISSI